MDDEPTELPDEPTPPPDEPALPDDGPASPHARIAVRGRVTRVLRRAFDWCAAPAPENRAVARLVVRGVGLVFAIAFVSYAVQVRGLIGEHGILPASQWLESVGTELHGVERFWMVPTVFWVVPPTDVMLSLVCWVGALFGALVVIGVFPRLLLAFSYMFYLSLTHVDSLFLGYQWDALLLEVGFAAIFLAPPAGWMGRSERRGPARIALLLVRLILFRLYFLSAVVKLGASTPYWSDLTALSYHFETQPLPNALAFTFNALPSWLLEVGTAATVVIEGLAPLLFFLGRRPRLLAFWLVVGLQALIGLTGNYGCFNVLTVVLALSLLDDRALTRFVPHRWRREPPPADTAPGPLSMRISMVVIASLVILLGGLQLVRATFVRVSPEWLTDVMRWTSPPRIANSYGLFANMTTTRPEIDVEGSADGETWTPFVFPDKPGPLDRAPPWVEPHMPRLDWQMWFAALYGDCRRSGARWFQAFARALLEGTPEVRALLEDPPFDEAPPRYLRATLWDYHFADAETHSRTGQWWVREPLGAFCPTLTLDRSGRLRVAHLAQTPPARGP